jgi:hypothetical protein
MDHFRFTITEPCIAIARKSTSTEEILHPDAGASGLFNELEQKVERAKKKPPDNRNGARALRRLRRGGGTRAAIAEVKAEADRHALDLLPPITEIRSTGKTSFGEIAAEPNKRGILSARHRQWYPTMVSNLLKRGRLF